MCRKLPEECQYPTCAAIPNAYSSHCSISIFQMNRTLQNKKKITLVYVAPAQIIQKFRELLIMPSNQIPQHAVCKVRHMYVLVGVLPWTAGWALPHILSRWCWGLSAGSGPRYPGNAPAPAGLTPPPHVTDTCLLAETPAGICHHLPT